MRFFKVMVTNDTQVRCGFRQLSLDFSGILQSPQKFYCRVKFFLGSHDFPSLVMTLRWNRGHLRHVASITRLLLCYPVIFLTFHSPLHPQTIRAITSRSSGDHLTFYPGETKWSMSTIAGWSLGHLKVIARQSGAWLRYLCAGCSNQFPAFNAQLFVCDCNSKTLLSPLHCLASFSYIVMWRNIMIWNVQ